MTPKPTPLWLGRYPMVDPEHAADLEQRSAILEFGGKLPRHEAEAKAHDDYRKDQLHESAAFHLVGMKAAHAAGSVDNATKHGALYVLALRALGHDSEINPPEEVASKAKHTPGDVYRFKAHPADTLSIRTHNGEDKPLEDPKKLNKSLRKDDLVGKPLMGADAAQAKRPVESRRYGVNGRVVTGLHSGKLNPYFDYSDYVPESMRLGGNRPSGITIHQNGRNVTASLNGGFGEVKAFRRGDGGYAIMHDGLKHAHELVRPYHQHVIRALADHLKEAHGASYFEHGSDPSPTGPVN